MEMVADRIVATRAATWQEKQDDQTVNRTMGIATLGGATLDNEENYLIKKLFTAAGCCAPGAFWGSAALLWLAP